MVGKLANSALTRMPSVQERRRFAEEMPKNTGTKGMSFEETPAFKANCRTAHFFWQDALLYRHSRARSTPDVCHRGWSGQTLLSLDGYRLLWGQKDVHALRRLSVGTSRGESPKSVQEFSLQDGR